MSRQTIASPWRREPAALALVVVLSLAANLLALTGPLYMLQVYDRVLSSRSMPTLVALSVLAVGLYLALGLIEYLRSTVLVRLSDRYDQFLLDRILTGTTAHDAPAVAHDTLMHRLDGVRASIISPALTALFDLPWLPIYLLAIAVMSPTLAIVASIGIVALVVVTCIGQALIQRSERAYETDLRQRSALLRDAQPARETLRAMGMRPRLQHDLQALHDSVVIAERRLSARVGTLGAISRTIRNLLQAAVIGAGAYLAIGGEVSTGAIIAASILAGRAVQPAEQVLAHWSAFVRARQDRRDLLATLPDAGRTTSSVTMPRASHSLVVEPLGVVDIARGSVVLRDVGFTATAGEIVGIAGASAAGKSTLLRALVGVMPIQRGCVRLDGADVRTLCDATRARDIGYLAQALHLLPGSIGEIIARHRPDASREDIVTAATAAGLHDIIVRLPRAYETRIDADGSPLSPGVAQRLALARALFGEPFLLVLDEPTTSLDADGNAALLRAITHVKSRGGIVVVATHQQRLLALADRIVELDQGRIAKLHAGPAQPPRRTAAPRLAVAHSKPAMT